jgi:hypothetical protein
MFSQVARRLRLGLVTAGESSVAILPISLRCFVTALLPVLGAFRDSYCWVQRCSSNCLMVSLRSLHVVPGAAAGDVEAAPPGDADLDGLDDEYSDESEDETPQLIPEQEVDTDALSAILGLCNLYATEDMLATEESAHTATGKGTRVTTACAASGIAQSRPFSTPTEACAAAGTSVSDAESGAVGKRTRFGKIRFVRQRRASANMHSDHDGDDGVDQEDDDWEEVQLTARDSTHFRQSVETRPNFTRQLSDLFGDGTRRSPASLSNVVRMQGYLNKRKPGSTSEYQRRFFILTDLQLMYFENEEDVALHINRRKGAVKIADITNVDRYDPNSLCIINVAVRGRVYALLAADRTLADEWYDMILDARDKYRAAQKANKASLSAETARDDANSAETGPEVAQGQRSPASRSSSGVYMLSNITAALGLGGGAAQNDEEDNSEAAEDQTQQTSAGVSMMEMVRRGTTNARRGLGSIYYGASSSAHGTSNASNPADEVWKHGWNVSHLPRKMGYLQKKGEVNNAWRQRWFVLDTTGNLSWYDKAGAERAQKPNGSVSIGEMVCVNEADPAEPRIVEFRHVQGRVFQLEAGSDLDAADWRKVLTLWIDSARAAVDKYNREHKDPYLVGANNSTSTYDQDRDEEESAAAGATAETDGAPAAHTPVSADIHAAPRKLAGYLLKCGGLNSAFTRRWLVLDAPGVVTWYEKPSHELKPHKSKGSLQLSEVMCVKEPRDDAPCLLEIRHMQGRTYEMETTTAMEATEWRAELNKWLRVAHSAARQARKSRQHSILPPADYTPPGTLGTATQASTVSNPASPLSGELERESLAGRAFGRLTDLFGAQTSSRKYEALGTAGVAELEEGKQTDVASESTATERIEALTRARDGTSAISLVARTGGVDAETAEVTRATATVPQASTRRVFWGAPTTADDDAEAASPAGSDNELDVAPSAEQDEVEEADEWPTPTANKATDVWYDIYGNKQGGEELDFIPLVSSPMRMKGKRAPTDVQAPSSPSQGVAAPRAVSAATPPAGKPASKRGSTVVGSRPNGPAAPQSSADAVSARADPIYKPAAKRGSTVVGSRPTAFPRLSPGTATAPSTVSASATPTGSYPPAAKRGPRRGSHSPLPALRTDADSPVQLTGAGSSHARESPSFSRVNATITGRASTHSPTGDSSPSSSDGLPRPDSRQTLRRQSSVERALDARRRGFTSVTPTSVTALRNQAGKRKNILESSATLAKTAGRAETRRESDLANSKFMNRMAKRHSSELVDNMQKKSYKDMNAEFWVTHKWYLAAVVCFVTLNVLYTTAYIVTTYD